MDIKFGVVNKIKDFYSGKRILIDFMESFSADDCVFVGNTNTGFCLLPSENRLSDNYLPRSFRFNVGSINQYIKTQNGVKYLSEIVAGDKIAVLKKDKIDFFPVARCKCEIRDFVRIEISCEINAISIILQKGETTSLCGNEGFISLKNLKVGDSVKVSPYGISTHLGTKKSEFCEEY